MHTSIKHLSFFALLAFSFSSYAANPQEEMRTWTVNGKPIEGRMDNSNEKAVVIVDKDGKRLPTGKKQLSPEDALYVQEIEEKRSGKPLQPSPSPASSSAPSQPTPASPSTTPEKTSATTTGDIQSDGMEWADTGKKFNAEATLQTLKPGYSFKSLLVPMRDGVGLATTVFTPPGDGPWPVILIRTPYERAGGAKYFKSLTEKKDFVCVIQDPRGDGDSQGSPGDPINNEIEISDGYDTIDWVSKQPWCNGRVGMTGGSGNGMCAAMAYLSKHPNLVVVNPTNSAGNSYLYWSFENGVRRWMYGWLSNRNLRVAEWPKPTLYNYDMQKWNRIVEAAAKDNPTVYIGTDGWFNIFCDSATDTFELFGPTGKVFMNVGATTHGGDPGLKFPFKTEGKPESVSFTDILDGKNPPAKSQIVYAVMGDASDPNAPGNVKKTASSWPPPSKPTSFYFTKSGGLTTTPPSDSDGFVTYPYDPKNPAPTIGGGWSYGKGIHGAQDQTPLKDRNDVVRFISEPLAEPLAVIGKLKADLAISSDVPDTTFVVKFVDIYPDGREIILREGAAMARYREGLDKQAGPMEKDKIYHLEFPCNSTAIVFNKDHRIGIFVTSSSQPAYEVHPNTYEPVSSYKDSPIANNNIHCSKTYPSRVILPVVEKP